MVQQQLCTLEQLMTSGFGRPFPRHGLQLLFWFANCCVTCDLINAVVVVKLVSDCQPESGSYGFHLFGNAEELLPVLSRSRRSRSKRQVAYFEVGNLNTETYPASANLPAYVRENYRLDGNRGNSNTDRIIIGYQVRTQVVETVYVTEHDGTGSGRFSTDRTYEISPELMEAMQSPQLDLTLFLTWTGYCRDLQVVNDMEDNPEPSAQLHIIQSQGGPTVFLSEDDQQLHYIFNTTSDKSSLKTFYSKDRNRYRKLLENKRPRASSYCLSGWEQLWKGFDDEVENRKDGGGGVGFMKLLLGAGALYLAARCLIQLTSWWKADFEENILQVTPWRRTAGHHIMLDYVY